MILKHQKRQLVRDRIILVRVSIQASMRWILPKALVTRVEIAIEKLLDLGSTRPNMNYG